MRTDWDAIDLKPENKAWESRKLLGTPDGSKSGKKEIDTAQILLASISEPGKFYSIFFSHTHSPARRRFALSRAHAPPSTT